MPEDWKDLVTCGEASARLLRVLWRGETENHRFLLLLAQKLGLFAPIKKRGTFLVPSTVSAASTGEAGSCVTPEDVKSHLGDDGQSQCFDFHGHLPNGVFERLVVQVIKAWEIDDFPRPDGWQGAYPVVPGGAFLSMGSDPFVLSLDDHKVHVRVKKGMALKEMQSVLAHVKDALETVNKLMYSERLRFTPPELGNIGPQLRGAGFAQAAFRESEGVESSQAANGEEHVRLVQFFEMNAKLSRKFALEYAKLILEDEEDETLAGLKHYFDSDRSEDSSKFRKYLADCAISKEKNVDKIIQAFREYAPMDLQGPELEPYVLGFFGGENLDKVRKEKEEITSVLKQKQKQCVAFDMGALSIVLTKVLSQPLTLYPAKRVLAHRWPSILVPFFISLCTETR